MRFIDNFDAILLDMGNTFMFDADRFSESEDFGQTYRQLRGTILNDTQVKLIILEVFKRMGVDYNNPAYYECFPSVKSYLLSILEDKRLPISEIELLEQVFAMQEVGRIPNTHAEAIRQLGKTHKLGVVSNIWCQSKFFLKEFQRVEITDLFETIIFSSDYGLIKPSPLIYRKAIEQIEVNESKIVFVGDSLLFDIMGAKAVGLSAVWINANNQPLTVNALTPDLVIQDLRNLL